MIVNFAVYSENLLSVLGIKRLAAGKRVHDSQTLMSQNTFVRSINTAPVWSSMPDFRRHFQCLCSPIHCGIGHPEYSYKPAHTVKSVND